jgi:hypothetical protein
MLQIVLFFNDGIIEHALLSIILYSKEQFSWSKTSAKVFLRTVSREIIKRTVNRDAETKPSPERKSHHHKRF